MKRRYKNKLPADSVTAPISRLSHDGRGIALINGKVTFIFGALPEELVKFRYTYRKNSFDEGKIEEILTPSSKRIPQKCPHFSICGGCNLQHVKIEDQIQHKESMLLEFLEHQDIQPSNILSPITNDEPWGYRRKARLSVKYLSKKEKMLIGFCERNSSLIADIDHCPILHPSVGNKIMDFKNLFIQLEIREFIPQMEIAVGDAENQTAIIIRHLKPFTEKDIIILEEFFKKNHLMLFLQPKGPNSVFLQYPKEKNNLLQYELSLYSLKFNFHPLQFTQINHAINQKMIEKALDLLDIKKTDSILDLFCGIGNFTLPLAKFGLKVIGVEGDEPAVHQARKNAENNQIFNAEFFCANLFENPSNEAWFNATYDKILLDPPRAGAKEILAFIPRWQPQLLVYISCNPATLARDAKIIREMGYQLQKTGVIDMFSHTKHVESISLFVKEK